MNYTLLKIFCEELRSSSFQIVAYWLLISSDCDAVEGGRRVQQARCMICLQSGKGENLENGLLELPKDDGIAQRKM